MGLNQFSEPFLVLIGGFMWIREVSRGFEAVSIVLLRILRSFQVISGEFQTVTRISRGFLGSFWALQAVLNDFTIISGNLKRQL